jgi:hypothetical protein
MVSPPAGSDEIDFGPSGMVEQAVPLADDPGEVEPV